MTEQKKGKTEKRIRTRTGTGTDKISRSMKAKMYAAYREKQTACHISLKTGVHKQTALRYIEKYGWKERIRKYNLRVNELADEKLAERQANNLVAVQIAISEINTAVQAGVVDPKYADLDKLIRLEQLLSGGTERKETVEVNIRFNKDGE